MSFKKRLLDTDGQKESEGQTAKKVKLRSPLFVAAETFLNHHYGVREWQCLDQESETAMPGNRAICVSQAPVGLRLYSETAPPHQLLVHSMVAKDKEESTVTLSMHAAEAKTRIVSAERIADGTGHDAAVNAILRGYLTHLLSVVTGDEHGALEPRLDYTSLSKDGVTYVRFEMTSKPSSTKVAIPVPWPGADKHGLRLEELSAVDAASQRIVLSFFIQEKDK